MSDLSSTGISEAAVGVIEPLSVTKINRTQPGYTETRDGFAPALPTVGTITHDFVFQTDPWPIDANDGSHLALLSQLKLSLSKVFNINNTTDTFYVLSWTPNYPFRSLSPSYPAVSVYLFDANGALLDEGDLGGLGAQCGVTDRQSKKKVVDSIYFDRVQSAAFSLGPASWRSC